MNPTLGLFDMDNFKVKSKGNSRLYLIHAGWAVFLRCYQCFLSLYVFVVAAVLEGVHFSFGSGAVPILFQVLIQSAVPILLFFGYFTNKLRKKNTLNSWTTFLSRGTCFFNCFLLSF